VAQKLRLQTDPIARSRWRYSIAELPVRIRLKLKSSILSSEISYDILVVNLALLGFLADEFDRAFDPLGFVLEPVLVG
jgi:hypothetical protein